MKTFARSLTLLLFGVALGGGATVAAFRYHVVRADDGWHVVNSGTPMPSDVYADVRGWSASDWSAHPKLAAALVEAGRGAAILRTAAGGAVDRLLNRN